MKKIMRGFILGAFGCFGIAIFLLFSFSTNGVPTVVIFATILLIVAYTLFRIYVLLTGRYGASPRLDERLTIALKGLSSEYSLFNYVFDVPHVLLNKSNIWLLELYEVSGIISYDQKNDKWSYKKGGNLITKLLSSDSFRNPIKDLDFMEKDWRGSLEKIKKQSGLTFPIIPIPQKILVFMHSDVEIHAEDSNVILIKGDKLKELIRTLSKKDNLPNEDIKRLISQLPDFAVS